MSAERTAIRSFAEPNGAVCLSASGEKLSFGNRRTAWFDSVHEVERLNARAYDPPAGETLRRRGDVDGRAFDLILIMDNDMLRGRMPSRLDRGRVSEFVGAEE